MPKFLIILSVFLVCNLNAQKFGSRSGYEKRWTIFHPFTALKVKKIYKKCLPFYEELKKTKNLDSYESGGKLDAFRHTFFMAAFSQKIKTKKIRKLGIAHEKGNYTHFLKGIYEEGELPDSLSSVMDLQNNELGFKLASQNKKLELNKLKDLVIIEIKNGNAVYFKRNQNGQYITCSREIISLSDFKNKWHIPKCLINTDN